MKKILSYILFLVIGAGIGAGAFVLLDEKMPVNPTKNSFSDITSLSPANQPANISPLDVTPANTDLSETLPNEVLVEAAYEIVSYLKENDYVSLSKAVHPDYGCVFSPYSCINLSTNKCFLASQIAGFAEDDTKYVWGLYDGIGTPIELTPDDYFKRFVFNADYDKAPIIGVNHIVKTGNSLETVSEVFPNAQYVEFHFPEIDPRNEGMDWCTLRLVFEKYGDSLRLTAIVHSQWTI